MHSSLCIDMVLHAAHIKAHYFSFVPNGENVENTAAQDNIVENGITMMS